MNKFKKKSVALFATTMLVVAAAGYVYQQSQAEESLLSELAMANVEALADSENGCVSKSDKNDGDCVKGGSMYFCEDSYVWHDCVIGEYH